MSVGIIDSAAYPGWTVALPAGAICLGLFFICYIFENEAARFDEEQRARLHNGKATSPAQAAPEGGGYGRPAAAKNSSAVS